MPKKKKTIWRIILDKLTPSWLTHTSQEGMVDVNHGSQEVVIKLKKTPVDIWVSFDNECNTPVCVGDVDRVGIHIIKNGCILYTDIKSAHRRIFWLANL